MRDGHIHTPYCPHGTTDPLKSYIEHAIEIGYHSMTFTEHAPLPKSFTDPVPDADSGMAITDVDAYIKEIKHLQAEYKKDIKILLGFEVDFIEGYERETEEFLNEYGAQMDDSILSVHFIKGSSSWYCIDYSPRMFEAAAKDLGGISQLYRAYYNALRTSVNADLGSHKPSRIGHMSLVKKFQGLYPAPDEWESLAFDFLKLVNSKKLQLDYNGAGTQKPHCNESYPPLNIAKQASTMGIPLVYGSDAHKTSGLKQGFSHIDSSLLMP